MPKTTVNGIGLFYQQGGEGIPIVFIAGFLADHTNWQPLIDALSPRYQHVTFDHRNVGQSDITSEPFTVEVMAEDVHALLVSLGISKAYVIGQSMGSVIALHLAAKHPECVDRLVLLNPLTHLTNVAHQVFLGLEAMIEANLASSILAHAFLPWSFSEHFLADQRNVQSVLATWSEAPYPTTLEGFRGQFAALQQVDSLAIAGKLTCPTLVLAAQNDLLAPPSQAEKLSEGIPGSDFMILPSSGHAMHVEQPSACAKHIEAFFSQSR